MIGILIGGRGKRRDISSGGGERKVEDRKSERKKFERKILSKERERKRVATFSVQFFQE